MSQIATKDKTFVQSILRRGVASQQLVPDCQIQQDSRRCTKKAVSPAPRRPFLQGAKTRSFLDRRLYLKVETYSDGQVKAR